MKPLDRRLLRHARSARPFVIACAGLGTLTALLVLGQAELLASLVSRAFLGGVGVGALAVPVMALAAVVLGRSAAAWASETVAQRASASVLGQLRTAVVSHVLAAGPTRRAGRSPADVATLATRGVDRLDGYFARYLPTLLVASVVPLLVAGRILLADWVAAVIVAATVPLIPIFMVLIGLYTRSDTRRQWRTLSVLGNHFLDLVAGLAVLTAFGRARAQLRSLAEITERYRTRTMRTLRVAFLSALALELLATLSVALVAVSIGLRLVDGGIDLRTGLLVLILAPEVYLPLRAVGTRFHDSAEGVAAAEEILALLDETPPARGRVAAPDPSTVDIELRGVTVAGRGGPALSGTDVVLRAGEVVGITGSSGAGKSTLLDLLLGWYPPAQGAVLVGGTDLTEIDRDAWLARIAWVPQHPVLLAGTVADNIRLGDPAADEDRVRDAALAAALDVPLWTEVGELGAGLSTGQRRRVALARAVLADRPLLLLDEPTEGVDADTEDAIVAALPAVLAGRSAVIVTHRPRVLEVCDRVLTVAAAPAAEQDCPAARPSPAPAPATGSRTSRQVAPQPGGRTGGTWRWLADAVSPHRGRLALACLAGAAALGSGVALTATSAWLISTAALHPPVLTLMVAIVAVRTFGLAKGLLRYLERLLSHDIALRAIADLRLRVWSTLVRLGPAVTARLRRGELLDRLVSDVDNQQDVLVRGLVPAVSAAVVGLGASIGIGVLLPEAGIALAIGLAAASVLAPLLTVASARAAQRHTGELRAVSAAATVELLGAAPELIAFGGAAGRHTALRRLDTALTSALRRTASARGIGIAVSTLAIGVTMIACLLLGVAALRAGRLPGPELAVLVLTPLATAELIAGLPDAAASLITARYSAARLAQLDATPTPATEPVAPQPVHPSTALALERLAVGWPGATDVVRDIDLRLGAHRGAVLTGPSGAGKSTTLAAIMRHLDPSAGQILLDGTDTRDLSGDDVRTQFAWCGPDTHLFDSTLRENLRLAAPLASDGQVLDALRHARLADWVASLPDGLDTALGAHGTPVSGGERQRIGVARAILADRPFLLLDEPTAHLDGHTATALATELSTLTAGRAALVVTHRPADFPTLPVTRVEPADVAA